MSLIRHDKKTLELLDQIIVKDDGTPLRGEIDIYRRICRDCATDPVEWHMWHDVHLPLRVNGQAEIQVDFILACRMGVVLIEVKGGRIVIRDGNYYWEQTPDLPMPRTPFEQAEDYKHAILRGLSLPTDIFITTACASPHSRLQHTNHDSEADQGYKLWSAHDQEDDEASFAAFCDDVISKDKDRHKWKKEQEMDADSLDMLAETLGPNINHPYDWTSNNLSDLVNWVNQGCVEALEALRRNQRLVVQGGPGTGKTTMAKAYAALHPGARGLYLCWNRLLCARMEHEMKGGEFGRQCQVRQFQSFVISDLPSGSTMQPYYKDKSSWCRHLADLSVAEAMASYDYIIADEAQDYADWGLPLVLEAARAADKEYLVFYDTQQGYGSAWRGLEEEMRPIIDTAAHYHLSENRRVPSNLFITQTAERLTGKEKVSSSTVVNLLERLSKPYLTVERVRGGREAAAAIRRLYHALGAQAPYCREHILLLDKGLENLMERKGTSIMESIENLGILREVNGQNLNDQFQDALPYTTILKYKGLESQHVYLVMGETPDIDALTLYVGMTRAISSVHIILVRTN